MRPAYLHERESQGNTCGLCRAIGPHSAVQATVQNAQRVTGDKRWAFTFLGLFAAN
jgi:hypothetical protein